MHLLSQPASIDKLQKIVVLVHGMTWPSLKEWTDHPRHWSIIRVMCSRARLIETSVLTSLPTLMAVEA